MLAGEAPLARELVRTLGLGMVALADRGFCGFELREAARRAGAELAGLLS